MISDALALVEGITSSNVYELNEKYVLNIYLRSFVSGVLPTTGMLDTMYDIGSQCPYVNGPAVYDARSLYEKFTGYIMPDVDCPELGSRSNEHHSPLAANGVGVAIYPNPADDILVINLPVKPGDTQYNLILSNVLGNVVIDTQIYPGNNQIPIKV